MSFLETTLYCYLFMYTYQQQIILISSRKFFFKVQNLPWPQYKKNVYGVLSVGKTKNMDSQSINEMIKGEQRRWGFADMDKDGALNVVEFQVVNNLFKFNGWKTTLPVYHFPKYF